jgi:hypothetical protein
MLVNFRQYINSRIGQPSIVKGGIDVEDLLWNVFKKSGTVDAFLAYKDYQRATEKVEEDDCGLDVSDIS